MQRKGINYDVGIELKHVTRPTFDMEVVHRELEIIKNDLHCNAVRIAGTDIDRLITAAEDALEQGLEVWLSPQRPEKSEQETLDYIVTCAAAAEALRQRLPALVFILGSELTLFMQGIIPGKTVLERVGNPAFREYIQTGAQNKPLHAFLAQATGAVRQVFHGNVTYASVQLESVDWGFFDFVCLDHYREARNRDSYAESLKRYFLHGKPVIITEFGCCTYQGAEQAGGRGWMIVDFSKIPPQLNGKYVRDEGLQAQELSDLLALLEGAGVDGMFVFTFVAPAFPYHEDPRYDLDMASYALVKSYAGKHGISYPEMMWEPKAAFKTLAKSFAKHESGVSAS
ncbi:hypothetical protein KSF_104810 [Reticulibacter mediterranei]|uniref:Abortive infection protein n=1 Tax=Reticulibacter mediterranei TaxID=2778369 RepID=A0A8J3N965_9CHLR|nr:abortive infection protein [Reticulibacter mediterranei]GHP00434.1 hypothetical protein KSF_104810 [Reticulibacter mediterranei]